MEGHVITGLLFYTNHGTDVGHSSSIIRLNAEWVSWAFVKGDSRSGQFASLRFQAPVCLANKHFSAQIKCEMRVSTLARDISFNSLHIKNSSHGIGVHSSVTVMIFVRRLRR